MADPLAEIRAGIEARLEERRLLLAGDETQVAKLRDCLVRSATNFLIKQGTPQSHALVIAVQAFRRVRFPMAPNEARRLVGDLIEEGEVARRHKPRWRPIA